MGDPQSSISRTRRSRVSSSPRCPHDWVAAHPQLGHCDESLVFQIIMSCYQGQVRVAYLSASGPGFPRPSSHGCPRLQLVDRDASGGTRLDVPNRLQWAVWHVVAVLSHFSAS